MRKILADRGYTHCAGDEDFSRHGDYARNIQYAFSKEHAGNGQKVVDIVFLGADMHAERIIIGFFRENVSIENGVLANQDTSIPLSKFSLDEFEKQIDRLIPKGSPVGRHTEVSAAF
ncbi:hypothetical protein [Tichowtungia aerotolerans]|uniref:Uncharacterized protein n=1 Tax=Tichowtungia aerotolerans TaxID=2697043 RepID=A0A6P1MDR2_9BACT|nr:hypothetical protein [Tichowtungia aerotolerans]QHI69726.1 hypothetical protein GT409_09775 [Tichowtungia aerotolerans]